MIGTISIPAAHVRAPIVQGVAESDLAHGAGHYRSTCWFGMGCTVAIAGHDVTFVPSAEGGHVFNQLAERYLHHKNMRGRRIFIESHGHSYAYRITRQFVVSPSTTYFLNRRQGSRLYLTTCYEPGSAASRLVTEAVGETP